MKLTKILCPIDFSAGSRQALRVAAHLAAETKSELTVVHAWYVPASSFNEYVISGSRLDASMAEAKEGLEQAVRDATAAGASRVTSRLLKGVPWAAIVATLEHESFDLCVIGTHGRTGLARVLVGSVAEKVIRHAACSVLAVRPDGEVRPFRHVLVPTDFSDSADYALTLAAGLVVPDGTVTLLHVFEIPVSYVGELPTPELAADLDKYAPAAFARAEKRLRALTPANVKTRYRIGYAGAQTLAVLDHDRSFDLVVMGSHGRTGIKRVLLGSVAEKVVRHASCPVLVARKRD